MTTSTLIKKTTTSTTKTQSKESLIDRLIGQNFDEEKFKLLCVGQSTGEGTLCVGSI